MHSATPPPRGASRADGAMPAESVRASGTGTDDAASAAARMALRLCRLARRGLLVVGATLLAACSSKHYVVNAPLETDTRTVHGYATRNLSAPGNSDSLLVIVSFSGGGYRAAAMAYAALEVLRDTPIVWGGEARTMLQELDVVSAVSAGSLTAAYYARDPVRFFDEFQPRVLGLDLQSRLYERALSIGGLWSQTSPTYGRGDLLAEVLDEQVFGGLTYGQLPRRRPMVYVNATDMRFGDRFAFSQDQFDHLCSDLDRFGVARAVAASMAIPIVFSPVTLWNHSEHCAATGTPAPVSGRAARARYVHLVDGGLADNTGVRTILENTAVHGGLLKTSRLAGLRGVRTGVLIFVNASVDAHHVDDDRPQTPGLWRQLRSAIDVPIDRYSASSLHALDGAVRAWRVERDAALGAVDDFHVIEVGVGSGRHPALADAVRRVPTALRIEPGQVDLVRRFVQAEFATNPTWQRLIARLGSTPTQASGPEPAAAAALVASTGQEP